MQAALDLSREVRQDLDEERGIAAGIVDVGLHQDAVAGGLVELDVETLGKDVLELGAIEARLAADEGKDISTPRERSVAIGFSEPVNGPENPFSTPDPAAASPATRLARRMPPGVDG